jgi:hypothetical protein
MLPDPSEICFGLSEEQDRISCESYLQLLGRKEFAELLAKRLSTEEIEALVELTGTFLRTHLSKQEYHSIFLLGDHQHDSHPGKLDK